MLVLNESLVQYEGSTIKLEHGGVTISTSKLLATRAGDVKVSPVASVWTEFEVRDVDGKVQIAARKGDLTISDNTGPPHWRKVKKPLETNRSRRTIHRRRRAARRRRRREQDQHLQPNLAPPGEY